MIILFSINSTCTYGVEKGDSIEFILKNIQKTTNGADVKLGSSETNIDKFNIIMSTKGLDKGYYTTYIYEDEKRDWSNYEAIAFDIENESDNAIRINLNIKQSDGTLVSTDDNNIVLKKSENGEVMEIIHPSYGAIEISKKFKGTIYVPFNSFSEKDKINSEKMKTISKIASWGVVTILPENEEVAFVLSKFTLINKGSNMGKYFNTNFSIKGDELVDIPVAGESISDYKIESDNKENLNNTTVKFQLKEPVDGITLNDSGRLTLTPDVEPQKIQICAIIDGSINQTKEVQLMNSWTLDATEIDGTRKSVPKAGEVSEIISNDNILMSKNALIGTRVVMALIAIIFGYIYVYWKKQKK